MAVETTSPSFAVPFRDSRISAFPAVLRIHVAKSADGDFFVAPFNTPVTRIKAASAVFAGAAGDARPAALVPRLGIDGTLARKLIGRTSAVFHIVFHIDTEVIKGWKRVEG